MKNTIKIFTAFILTFNSFGLVGQDNLTDEIRKDLINKIESIGEKDQRHRSVISLGTFDQDIIAKDRAMRDTASIQVYLKFAKEVVRILTTTQEDSLWKLQHKLDFENYEAFKTIVKEYGYPSPERLGVKSDQLYVILLHPPVQLDVREYQEEVMTLLRPEVLVNRFDPILLASFYDNMLCKILKEPQLYGTNKVFNPATMSMGNPKIQDIVLTNKARIELGLLPLAVGEYDLID